MVLEELQDRLGENLLDLDGQQLMEVCQRIKVSPRTSTKKHALLRLIYDHVDQVMEKEDNEVAVQHLTELMTLTKELKRDQEPPSAGELDQDPAADELATLQKQYAELQLSFQASAQALNDQIKRLSA